MVHGKGGREVSIVGGGGGDGEDVFVFRHPSPRLPRRILSWYPTSQFSR